MYYLSREFRHQVLIIRFIFFSGASPCGLRSVQSNPGQMKTCACISIIVNLNSPIMLDRIYGAVDIFWSIINRQVISILPGSIQIQTQPFWANFKPGEIVWMSLTVKITRGKINLYNISIYRTYVPPNYILISYDFHITAHYKILIKMTLLNITH